MSESHPPVPPAPVPASAPASASASVPVRIAVVEDDPMVRQYFQSIIAMQPGYEIIGMAPDLASADALLDQSPDLFLLDIGLPDGVGYTLVPKIKARCGARALIISTFGDRDTVVKAIQAGADGYLLKDSSPAVILDGIAATLDGGAPVSPSAAIYLLGFLRGGPEPASPGPASPEHRLSARETELLQAFAKGQSYKEAARTLAISPHTVGTHVKSIYRKLEVNSRSDAIREAQRTGQA
ncbi:response regulator [Sphingomonas sp. 35-24ZXX]|uniref:response regulator n=1 Tax=Sphingomonas sp. 35-24ZXX TaxID=1545915 RepID=UPI0009DFF907|nr:response regulator transcription factor [Sphingomonas sp. 35-24ZXX]